MFHLRGSVHNLEAEPVRGCAVKNVVVGRGFPKLQRLENSVATAVLYTVDVMGDNSCQN